MNYNIIKHIGTLSDGKITTELNVIEWNGRKAQYDLRRWSIDETGKRTPYAPTLEKLTKLLSGNLTFFNKSIFR